MHNSCRRPRPTEQNWYPRSIEPPRLSQSASTHKRRPRILLREASLQNAALWRRRGILVSPAPTCRWPFRRIVFSDLLLPGNDVQAQSCPFKDTIHCLWCVRADRVARIEYARERELAILLDHRTMICPFLRSTLQLFVSGSFKVVLMVPFSSERCGFATRPWTTIVSVAKDEGYLDL